MAAWTIAMTAAEYIDGAPMVDAITAPACRRLPPAHRGPCRCGAEPVRTLGRDPYCADCANELLERCRRSLARDGCGVAVIAGHRRDDLGPGVYDCSCSACPARWSTVPGEVCPWCVEALDRLRKAQRVELLWPSWLNFGDDGPSYDALPADDRAVWDATRGRSGDGSRRTWAARLGGAVRVGLIPEAEARAALRRVSDG